MTPTASNTPTSNIPTRESLGLSPKPKHNGEDDDTSDIVTVHVSVPANTPVDIFPTLDESHRKINLPYYAETATQHVQAGESVIVDTKTCFKIDEDDEIQVSQIFSNAKPDMLIPRVTILPTYRDPVVAEYRCYTESGGYLRPGTPIFVAQLRSDREIDLVVVARPK